jgi:hypothetical protein
MHILLPPRHNRDRYLRTKLCLLLFSITKRLQNFLISHIDIFNTDFRLHLQQVGYRHVRLTKFTSDLAVFHIS